jgi:hypothetical protein
MSYYEFDETFPFDEIKIGGLKPLQGGNFLATLEIGDDPIIIQTPKCKTKNGIHKTSKVTYCDLLISHDNDTFLDNIQKMEEKIRHLIYKNAEKWFSDEMTMDDIEYHWNSVVRDYKNKKLLRTYIQKNKRTREFNLKIYDENEELLSNKLNEESEIICIIELIGLKFSSHSFYLEATVRQIMVFKKKEIFKNCLIKVGNKKQIVEGSGHDSMGDSDVQTDPIVSAHTETNPEEHISLIDPMSLSDIKNEIIKEVHFETVDDPQNDDDALKEETTNGLDPETVDEITADNAITPECANEQSENDLDKNSENALLNEEPNQPINEPSQENELNTTTPNDTLELGDLEEINLSVEENMNDANIKLRAPNEVYLDIYRAAKLKAKQLKTEAIKAHLDALKIKKTYMIDEIDSSSDEETPGLLSENS